MARKSRELRLAQTDELIAAYEAAGLRNDRNYRFARDMKWRLEHNKGLSPKRRQWLDSIIEEGVPEPKGDVQLLARVEAAANTEGMTDFDAGILREFAGKIRRGWDLSPKQAAWMEGLLERAAKIAVDGPWTPDSETLEKLKLCVKVANSYSTGYWSTRGGTMKALQNVRSFLEGTGQIDEWSSNKLISAMARPLREFASPKYKAGEMCWYKKQPAMIIEGPMVSETGHVVYSVLSSGSMIKTNNISKRK